MQDYTTGQSGSCIGPTLFSMFACDLKPLNDFNYFIKYADDSILLCPHEYTTAVEEEIAHVMNWALENKMTVNHLQTVEILFHRPNRSGPLTAQNDQRWPSKCC